MVKKPKDPNAPKKNQSSYFIFSNERRAQLAAKHKAEKPDEKVSITAISKIISAEWKEIDPQIKKGYEAQAAAQKVKYQEEMEVYKKTDNYKNYQAALDEWKAAEKEKKSNGNGKSPKSKKPPKKPKQPESMPKRPMSSYFLFANARRESMKVEHPDKKLTELAKLIGAEWKTISAEDKKAYEDKVVVAKKEYEQKMEEYKKTEEYTTYQQALADWKADTKKWKKADEMDVDSDDEPLKVSMPRKPKDEKCPKRPLTSYFLYAKDVRAATKEENPDMAITEIAKEISKKWKLLTEEEKKPFNDEAAALKEKYKKDVEEYEGSEAQLAFKAKLDEWKKVCEDRKKAAKDRAAKKKEREQKKKSPKKSPAKKKKAQKKRSRMEESSSDESSSGSYSSDSDSSDSGSSSSGSDSESSSGSESSSD